MGSGGTLQMAEAQVACGPQVGSEAVAGRQAGWGGRPGTFNRDPGGGKGSGLQPEAGTDRVADTWEPDRNQAWNWVRAQGPLPQPPPREGLEI